MFFDRYAKNRAEVIASPIKIPRSVSCSLRLVTCDEILFLYPTTTILGSLPLLCPTRRFVINPNALNMCIWVDDNDNDDEGDGWVTDAIGLSVELK